ncbi:MAG: peptidoglycan DD-metalloendopeptidase family protein [Spirulinaceae cyanobacterium SM2_1_0]|nr:peptidoglycan DD-metalloendopeptidase family protein [Spirulinaceae cyanobacterium SM2_1_0]
MLGIAAISMGATAGVLMPNPGDEVIAAESSLASPALAAESLDIPAPLAESDAGVELGVVIEPEIIEAVATPAIGPSLMQHRVEDGDTLWALSQSYGVSAEAIAASNSIDTGAVLTVGQTLKIPTTIAQPAPVLDSEPVAVAQPQQVAAAMAVKSNQSLDTTAASGPTVEETEAAPLAAAVSPAWREAQAQQAEAANSAHVYRVQSGDTLDAISRRFNVSTVELAQLNEVSDPRRLQPGQRLKVPTTPSPGYSESPAPRLVVPPQPLADEAPIERTVAMQASPGNDAHIEKLKDEVMRLRQEIRSQRLAASEPAVEIEAEAVVVSPTTVVRRPEAPVLLTPTVETIGRSPRATTVPTAPPPLMSLPPVEVEQERPRVIAAAPVPTEAYNRLLQLPAGRTVAPELPPLQGPEQYLPDRPQQFNGYTWPARGTLTSGYGPRWGRMHKGIDIAAPTGTPIFAAATGEVISAGWNNGGYGNLVDIRHPDGSMTRYAHNSRVLVRKGQRVDQGEQIALMGSTGFSTGPHLHFEIHPAGRGAMNPMAFLPRSR